MVRILPKGKQYLSSCVHGKLPKSRQPSEVLLLVLRIAKNQQICRSLWNTAGHTTCMRPVAIAKILRKAGNHLRTECLLQTKSNLYYCLALVSVLYPPRWHEMPNKKLTFLCDSVRNIFVIRQEKTETCAWNWPTEIAIWSDYLQRTKAKYFLKINYNRKLISDRSTGIQLSLIY